MTLEIIAVVVTVALIIGIVIGRLSASKAGTVSNSDKIRLSKTLPGDVEARMVEMIG